MDKCDFKNILGYRLKEIRELLAFTQQDYCEYLKDTESIETNTAIINGVENGRLITQEDLRNAVYHQVYNVRLSKNDEVLVLAEQLADFFVEHKIQIDLEKLMSCDYSNEVFYLLVECAERTNHIIPEEIASKTGILPFEVIVDVDFGQSLSRQSLSCIMNDMALFIYHFCFIYILRNVDFHIVIGKDIYMTEEFNEYANLFTNNLDWESLDVRSKGRYMINVNKQLSICEHILSLPCVEKYILNITNFIRDSQIPDLYGFKEFYTLSGNRFDVKENLHKYKEILKGFRKYSIELIKLTFYYYQHILIIQDESTITDLTDKFNELFDKDYKIINKIVIQDKVHDCLINLRKLLACKNEENLIKFSDLASSLYKLHRQIKHMDFYFEMECEPQKAD